MQVVRLKFYSHCTSMSTSFPMLSPIVFVAKHVYVPASCLNTSIIYFAKVTERAKKFFQNQFCQCLETVDSSRSLPCPTSSCLKNLQEKNINYELSRSGLLKPTRKWSALDCCQLYNRDSERPCPPRGLWQPRLLSRLAQLGKCNIRACRQRQSTESHFLRESPE